MNPFESAKRYVVYAPLGFVAMLRDIGPGMVSMLAERGRHELAKPNFVSDSVERVGEYAQLAVAVARPEIEKRFGTAVSRTSSATLHSVDSDDDFVEYTEIVEIVELVEYDELEDDGEDALPLADYDSLTSAQIISKIGSLTAAQRAELAAYELAHRKRKGVLSRLEAF